MRKFLILTAMLALSCTAASAQQFPKLPNGPYAHTCDNCWFDGRVLSCTCRNRAGMWLFSRMDWGQTCNRSVANRDGRLVCIRK